MSRLRRPFFCDRYFFATVALLKSSKGRADLLFKVRDSNLAHVRLCADMLGR